MRKKTKMRRAVTLTFLTVFCILTCVGIILEVAGSARGEELAVKKPGLRRLVKPTRVRASGYRSNRMSSYYGRPAAYGSSSANTSRPPSAYWGDQHPDNKAAMARGVYDPRGGILTSLNHPRPAGDAGLSLRFDPRGWLPYRREAQVLALGDRDSILAHYVRGFDLGASASLGYNRRDNVFSVGGRYDKSLVDYSMAVAANPRQVLHQNKRALNGMADIARDRAIADYSRIIQLRPKDVAAYHKRAAILRARGCYDKAVADYDRIVELDPKDAGAYWLRGQTHFDADKFDRAEKDFNDCLKLNPDNMHTAVWRFLSVRRAGRQADKELRGFISQQVKDISIWPGPALALMNGTMKLDKYLQASEGKTHHTKAPGLSYLGRAAGMRNPIAPPQQLSEAYFYAGQYQLLKGRTAQAHRFLQESKRIAVFAAPFVHQRRAAVSYGGAAPPP